ncbi:MAG TPA: acyltransferase [Alteromonas australica]|uniref:Acyltransferase n=1 Tax=Alteromonas australica TaxID=589873 RepID=A0A358DZR4_9ALTE|nr:acyltransferase [Alteromonas australica]HBU51413.1 acyltransferase [Alteromonas australica]
MKYRPEIDGLRALAVVPVILFHAGFELFSGGFVGVDVFFVISGYLITTIFIEEIDNQRFSIVNFYERRARRILPALFFVMLLCIPFAWLWMLPFQLKGFADSLIAVCLFASNILFWSESGYFDAATEEKPLLHTWSLAVEEQYYVLFPLFLLLAWRFGKSRVFWMIVAMAAVSLLLSEWGWRHKPVANFYLAPTRAWELFAGSIAAFIVQRQGVRKNNPLALLGLIAILFSIFAYDENTPFPSLYALVPVLGVVMLVLYANKETFAAKVLSHKLFVGIGLISYSAYLWHQPLFAFARIRSLEHPSATLMLILSAITILLAYLSWQYVEKPFRRPQFISGTRVFQASAIGLMLFIVVGTLGHFGIFRPHLSQQQQALIASFETISNARMDAIYPDVCHYTGNTGITQQEFQSQWHCSTTFANGEAYLGHVAVAGDSNAADIANGFRLNKMSVSSMSGAGCSLVPAKMTSGCLAMFTDFIDYLNNDAQIDTLVLTNYFSLDEYTESSIAQMLTFWQRFNGTIVFLHDTPRFPNHYQALLRGRSPQIDLHYDDLQIPIERLNYLQQNGIYTLSRNTLFCKINDCSYFSKDGEPLISDARGEHLSLVGAKLFVEVLAEEIATVALKPQ